MLRSHRHRLATTCMLVLSLLFSQLALAQYVCPQQADTTAMAAMMAAGTPCQGMDPDQAVLCHQHAADPAQNFEAAKLPSTAPAALVPLWVWPVRLAAQADPAAHAAAPATPPPDARPPPGPLFLRTARLRI